MDSRSVTGPPVPPRVSSKRKKLESEIDDIDYDIQEESKKIRLRASFDTPFWLAQAAIQVERIKQVRIKKSLSMLDLEIDDEDKEAIETWQKTEDGLLFMQKEAALELRKKAFKEHAELLATTKDEDTANRRAFIQIFFGSKLGFNLNNQLGKRPGRLQTMFRKELEVVYDIKPHPRSGVFWCPVLAEWVPEVVAGHLFPVKSGYEVMESIFGPPALSIDPKDPSKGKGELFRAVNGIIWSKSAEERFEKGQFVIVPDVNDSASEKEIRAWRRSKPREYKIRIVKPEAPEMQVMPKYGDITRWRDYNDRRLQFRTDFRPRTRYLYFAYCQAVLRNAYVPQASSRIMQAEVGKKYWGSTGRFMRKNMLLGFVEQLGHDYNYLLDNAFEEDDEEPIEPDPAGLYSANEDNVDKMRTEEEKWDDEEREADEKKEADEAENEDEMIDAIEDLDV